MASEVARRKNRLVEVCGAFPEVETSGAQHLTFQVHKRTFAYYLDNHQGDGRIALVCKATPADQDFLGLSVIVLLISLLSSAGTALQQDASHVYPEDAVSSFTESCIV
jgi:hypothetical protein